MTYISLFFLLLFIGAIIFGFIQRRKGQAQVKPVSRKKRIFAALWAGIGFAFVVLPIVRYLIINVLHLNYDRDFALILRVGLFMIWMAFGITLYQYFVEKYIDKKELLQWLIWIIILFGCAALYYYFGLSGKHITL